MTALDPIHPNLGLERAFLRRLDKEIRDMSHDVAVTVGQVYAENRPTITQDATPAALLRAAMKRMSRKWLKRFDQLGPELAEWFAIRTTDRSDRALKELLRKAGFTVRFKATAAQKDVLQATIGEQVGLIKSLATEHLQEVEGLVMRSVQVGRDLGGLTRDLQDRFEITHRRAAIIARDQNNKATAAMTRVRQLEVNPDAEAIWRHSGGGKHPRPTHVANDGKRYSVKTGWFDPAVGRHIWPGTEINCRCTTRFIVAGLT